MKMNIKKAVAFLTALTVLFSCILMTACGAKAELRVLDADKISAVYLSSTGEQLDAASFVKAYNESTVGKTVDKNDVAGSKDTLLFVTEDGDPVPVFVMGENKFIVGGGSDAVYFRIKNEGLYKLYTEAQNAKAGE